VPIERFPDLAGDLRDGAGEVAEGAHDDLDVFRLRFRSLGGGSAEKNSRAYGGKPPDAEIFLMCSPPPLVGVGLGSVRKRPEPVIGLEDRPTVIDPARLEHQKDHDHETEDDERHA